MKTQKKIPEPIEVPENTVVQEVHKKPKTVVPTVQTSELSTEIKIPTRGIFYDDGIDTFILRPMTVKEEKIMTTTRLVRTGEALNKVLQNCIEYPKVPIKSLKIADISYLMIALRQLSYGNNYDFTVQCPSCGNRYNDSIDLSQLPVGYLPDEAIEKNFTVKLPQSGKVVKIKLLDGYDEEKISSKKKNRAKYSNAREMYNETYVDRLMMSIVSVDGEELNEKELHDFVESLTVIDSETLRDTADEYSAGIDTEIETDCPMCDNFSVITMPLDVNFFRHSRRQNRSKRNR